MNEITIPYHLVLPAIICLLGLVLILTYRKKLFVRHKTLWISVTVFFIVYLLIVGSAAYNDIYYQVDLNRYDLDKDGFFSGHEITEAQTKAMWRLTNEVGRNFSFITGFIFAFIISCGVYVAGILISKFKRR